MNEEGGRRSGWIGRELALVLAASSVWGFSFSCFTLLPKFLVEETGATAAEIGLVSGAFGVASVLIAPFAGLLAGRKSFRAAIGIAAVLLAASAFGLWGAAPSLGNVIAWRTVQAFANALILTTVGVAVATLAPPEKLSQALGLSGASLLVMHAISPTVAEPLEARAGWGAVFLLAAGAAILSWGLASRIPASQGSRSGRPATLRDLAALLVRPLGREYAAIVALSGLAFGTLFTFQQPFALEAGRETVRGFFVAFTAGALFVRLGFGSLPDRFGRRRTAIVCLALYGLAPLGLVVFGVAGLEAVGLLFGLAHGPLYPSVNALAVTAVLPEERTRILSLFAGAFHVGIVATIPLGALATVAGYGAVFAVSALSAAGAIVVLARSKELADEAPGEVAVGLPRAA